VACECSLAGRDFGWFEAELRHPPAAAAQLDGRVQRLALDVGERRAEVLAVAGNKKRRGIVEVRSCMISPYRKKLRVRLEALKSRPTLSPDTQFWKNGWCTPCIEPTR
jgi:hypothetical protein